MGPRILSTAAPLVVFLSTLPSPAAEPAGAKNVPLKVIRPAVASPAQATSLAPTPPELQGIARVAPEAAEEDRGASFGELVTERYPDGKIKVERGITQDSAGNYVNHGPYTYYDRQGKVGRTGQFSNGRQQGRWMHRFAEDQGQLFSGLSDKSFAAPFLSEANFVDGRIHGAWTVKDSKGAAVVEWNFEHGAPAGKWSWWYSNGQKRLEANYRDGTLNGDVKEWDRDGKLLSDRSYVDGKWLDRVSGWHAPGQKSYEGFYLRVATIPEPKCDWWTATAEPGDPPTGEDQRHGQWISWYPNGNKKAEFQYDHDVLVGRVTWWYENGQKRAEGSYDNGQKAGTWITWHPNGLKESEGEFRGGRLVSKWSHWDGNGRLVEVREAAAPRSVPLAVPGQYTTGRAQGTPQTR